MVQKGRKTPSEGLKMAILRQQTGRCAYCNCSLVGATIHWDHFEPYAYRGNQSDSNWVASCSVCNLKKSSKVFTNDDQLYAFCLEMVKDHGSFEDGWPEGSTTEWPELCA